jgi:hypothetical protein
MLSCAGRTFDSQTRVYRSVSGNGTSSHIVRKSDFAAIQPLMPAAWRIHVIISWHEHADQRQLMASCDA